jgi:hypothetical protein
MRVGRRAFLFRSSVVAGTVVHVSDFNPTGLIWRDRVGSNGMKWDGRLETRPAQDLFEVLTDREGNFRTVHMVLFSDASSQSVPFDPTLSRKIKPSVP